MKKPKQAAALPDPESSKTDPARRVSGHQPAEIIDYFGLPPVARRLVPLMSLEDLCDYLQISTRTGHRLLDSGILPVYRIGKLIRVSQDDVEKYVQASLVPAGEKPHE